MIETEGITAVTGCFRSGTSCLTGLLERCGFFLGKNVRVLRRPTEFNPKGHFETDLMVTINLRLITELRNPHGIPYDIFTPPPFEDLEKHASERMKYFQMFIRKFDGNLVKDPLLSLTIPLWAKRWQKLNRVIFCLRDPVSTASSMEARYGLGQKKALQVHRIYKDFFINFAVPVFRKKSAVYFFDFETFQKKPVKTLSTLLEWLNIPFPEKKAEESIKNFYEPSFIHHGTFKGTQSN